MPMWKILLVKILSKVSGYRKHKNKLVHRELKPFNILVYPGRRLRISDLDEVTKVEEDEKGRNTIDSYILGTKGYWPKGI